MKRGDTGRGRDTSGSASRHDQPGNHRWGSREDDGTAFPPGDQRATPDGSPAEGPPGANGGYRSGPAYRGRPADDVNRGYGPPADYRFSAGGPGRASGPGGAGGAGGAGGRGTTGPGGGAGPDPWASQHGDGAYQPGDGPGFTVPPGGRQYLPNGRRVPPRGDRQFRAPGQAPGPYRAPFANSGRPDDPGAWPGGMRADGFAGPPGGSPRDRAQPDMGGPSARPAGVYRHDAMPPRGPAPGRRWADDGVFPDGRIPDGRGPGGTTPDQDRSATGFPGGGRPRNGFAGGARPGARVPNGGRPGGGYVNGGRPRPGFANGGRPRGGPDGFQNGDGPSDRFPSGTRPGFPETAEDPRGRRRPYGYGGPSRDRQQPQMQTQSGRRVSEVPQPPLPPGQLIRQRDSALPEREAVTGTAPIAAIAPDGLESFARDLRVLRAQAELDYPEMAERSHYTMKTLAAAAGGLRLPSLPVTIAYVQACGGGETEWEERWHKLAEKLGAEPESTPAEPASPPSPPAETGKSDEVYVITSAKPREPGW